MDANQELEKLFSAGDAWLMKYGIVTPVAHNNIILNIRVQCPKVLNVEYFLDNEARKIDLTLFVSRWFLLFGRKKKLTKKVLDLLNQYLHGYEITVKLRRFKEEK